MCRADGEDLNAWMVSAVWALAYRRYSTAYVARGRRRRAGQASGSGGASSSRPGAACERLGEADRKCAIKGNIRSGGVRIYNVPVNASYGRTRIDEAKGERWFSTPEEAEAAGWRRAPSGRGATPFAPSPRRRHRYFAKHDADFDDTKEFFH